VTTQTLDVADLVEYADVGLTGIGRSWEGDQLTIHTVAAPGTFDQVTHSLDGESRGLMHRVGDVFAMVPIGDLLSAPDTPASQARPWGLRFLRVPEPRAGKHEGGTNDVSTNSDGQSVEETTTD
jgi:hypothetical protein